MTTLPRTTPPATPEDPRLTAYTSGDLPHTEAAHFVTETAHDPAMHDDVARTHEFIAALEDALASEPLPQVDPPILIPRSRHTVSLPGTDRPSRRFSLFPALASALAMSACLIMIAALLIPTVSVEQLREAAVLVIAGLAAGALLFLRLTGRIGTALLAGLLLIGGGATAATLLLLF